MLSRLQARPKLLCWSLHNFFRTNQSGLTLQTTSCTVHNTGRAAAQQVEIIHKPQPDFVELYPRVDYQEIVTPSGEHIIRLPNLQPKQWVVVQMLSYRNPSVLSDVRWQGGTAQWIQVQPQRVRPQGVNIALAVLILIGIGHSAQWLLDTLTRLLTLLY